MKENTNKKCTSTKSIYFVVSVFNNSREFIVSILFYAAILHARACCTTHLTAHK